VGNVVENFAIGRKKENFYLRFFFYETNCKNIEVFFGKMLAN